VKSTLGGIFTADKSGKGAAAGSTRRLFHGLAAKVTAVIGNKRRPCLP